MTDKNTIEIKYRKTGAVLFSGQYDSLKAAVINAVRQGAHLAKANLVGANLAGAYLVGANLAGAYLVKANLAGANLAGAHLAKANLSRADLSGADLSGASFCGATIDGAKVNPDDIGGPGHILYALTEEETKMIEKGRES